MLMSIMDAGPRWTLPRAAVLGHVELCWKLSVRVSSNSVSFHILLFFLQQSSQAICSPAVWFIPTGPKDEGRHGEFCASEASRHCAEETAEPHPGAAVSWAGNYP